MSLQVSGGISLMVLQEPNEIEWGLQSPENFTMVKNKANPAFSTPSSFQRQVSFLITDAFYTPVFMVSMELHVASKKRFLL